MRLHKKDPLALDLQDISNMKRQNQTLKEDLGTQERNNGDLAKMELLQEESSNFAKRIEVECKRQRDLEQLIHSAEEELQDHRKKMSTSDGIQLPSLIKKQKALESQLEQIKLKHNESLAEINQLMEHINTARRERVIFSNVFKKLETDIRSKEEEFKRQLILRKQIEVELQQCQEAFDKMKEQSTTINRMNQQEQISILKSGRLDDDEILKDLPSMETRQPVQKEMKLTQHNQMQKAVDDANMHEFMFEKLKKETGLNSIEEIIHQFLNIEEGNNELYRKANELSDKIDVQEKELDHTRQQIKGFSKHGKEEEQQFEEVKFNYAVQVEKSQDLDQQISDAEKEIKDFQGQLKELADKLQIQVPENSDLTLMQLIEKRAYELVDISKYFDNHKYNIDQKRSDQESAHSHQEDQTMRDLLDGVEGEKEAEKIMSRYDFLEVGKKDIQIFQKKNIKKKKD